MKGRAAEQGDEPDEVRAGDGNRGPRRLSPVLSGPWSRWRESTGMRQTLGIAFVAVLLNSRPATAGGPPFDVQVCASGCGNAWVGYVNANPGEIAYDFLPAPQPQSSAF